MAVPNPANINDAQEEQAYTSSELLIYNGRSQGDITVGIAQSARNEIPGIEAMVIKAIAQWNSLGRNLVRTKFRYTGNSGHLMIISKPPRAPIIGFGNYVSEFPALKGNAPRLMEVYAKNFNSLEYNFKVGTLTHAFGHCLGLNHTDWKRWPGEIVASQIPGSPAVDNQSVMNRLADFMTPSNADINALRTLYPATAYNFKVNIVNKPDNKKAFSISLNGPVHKIAGFTLRYIIAQEYRKIGTPSTSPPTLAPTVQTPEIKSRSYCQLKHPKADS
ncbi:hypothetical protein VF13_39945, partial [Nostoc linckia z16]